MTYEEAIEKAVYVKWKIDTCDQGEQCWCRIIKCEEPMMYKEHEGDYEQEYYVVGPGQVHKETIGHIVVIHNEKIDENERYSYNFLISN